MKHVTHLPPIWETVLGVDIETTTRMRADKVYADPFQDRIVSVTISDGVNSWFLTDNYDSLLPLWIDPYVLLVIHNAEFDVRFLTRYLGMMPKCGIWDTLLIERILNAGNKTDNSLEGTLARRFGIILNKSVRSQFTDHSGVFTQEQLDYMEADALHLVRLCQTQLDELGGYIPDPLVESFSPGLAVIAWLENAVVPVVVEMSLMGVQFDVDNYQIIRHEIEAHLNKMERDFVSDLSPFTHRKEFVESVQVPTKNGMKLKNKRETIVPDRAVTKYVATIPDIYDTYKAWLTVPYWDRWAFSEVDQELLCEVWDIPPFGWHTVMTVNLNSTTQAPLALSDIVHEHDGDKERTVKSIGEPYLLEHFNDVLFISKFLEYRSWSKLLGVDYPSFVSNVTGRIHASWNQINAETGRFSCSEPNLQQVPRPEKGKPNFRALFQPRSGYKYVVADFSQQEPRVLAEVSGDPAMIKAANTYDIYNSYGIPVYGHEVTKGSPERHMLKTAVLADSYGGGAKSLSRSLKVTIPEAWRVKEKLLRAFPVAHQWGDKQLRSLVQRGYVTTLWGRRRYMPEIKHTPADKMWIHGNKARNTPIQGTAADISKLSMVLLYRWLKEGGYDACIVMVVHDEIVVEVREDQAESVCQLTEQAMKTAMSTICPHVLPGVEAEVLDEWGKV